ncbi:hypothetical protein FHX74_001343 [Friedmanniella endophytica]|uniref:ATP/GTP-binding protein n=1 Tax=Microlunatus kandeliicorticis TaxID=1759536 RepID=A0A7W3P5A6_9ACTN|nr:hypothetical protein [Microlunatus kandeliicorticis]MBA8793738.1 hypothetical protein [Microlunatus kandeliicorticis]
MAKYLQDYAAYQRRRATGATCGDNLNGGSACSPGPAPTPPPDNGQAIRELTQPNQPAALSPQQIAEIAVARLTVPDAKPAIGPPPSINRWKMAAVGYPLWLSAGTTTHIGPVTETVGAQSVALDARLASVTYRMGDGHTRTCAGGGTPWTESVQPGTPSPDCGYTYSAPSLPMGDYTVVAIATWAVTWTINGQSGVINLYTDNATQLPVGEVQALVR